MSEETQNAELPQSTAPENGSLIIHTSESTVRRVRGGKLAVFTQKVNYTESLLGKQSSRRLILKSKERIAIAFEEIRALNAEYIDKFADTDEKFENASLWLAKAEEKYDNIFSAIEDELETRLDEELSTTTSVTSRNSTHTSNNTVIRETENIQNDLRQENMSHVTHQSENQIESNNDIDEIQNTKNIRNTPLKPREMPVIKRSIDDWISNNFEKQLEFIERDELFSDTLAGLNLKIETFDGDPLRYNDFISSFKHQIHDRRSLSSAAKMTHLLANLTGPAKTAVEGYCIDERGYRECLKTLKELFGDKIVVSRAYIDRVIKGQHVSTKKAGTFRTFYHELFACWSALDRMNYFDDINSSESLKLIVNRLPSRSQERWLRKVADIRNRHKELPTLKHLVDFVKFESLAADDPVWGNFQTSNDTRPQNHKRQGAKVYATNATEHDDCMFCEGRHKPWECKNVPTDWEEKRNIVMKANACFNCLRPGHIVAKCSSKRRCQKCNGKHHTIIHREKLSDSPEDKKVEVVTASSFIKSGARLQVLPVVIVGPKGTHTVNALLDSGSQITLLSKDAAAKVGLQGKGTQLNVSTINGKGKPEPSSIVKLEMKALDSEGSIIVPQAYVIKNLQLSNSVPLSHTDIKNYSHLRDIEFIDTKLGNIDLLIGANAAEILLPLEYRKGKPGEPIAIRTPLGWCLLGGYASELSRPSVNSITMCSSSADTIESQFERLWKTEDFGTKYSMKKPFSKEDKASQTILDKARVSYGKYQMGLLWKDTIKTMPNNKINAEFRLKSLAKKFAKNSDYAATYTKEVQAYIDEGYAQEAVDCSDSAKRWYLPHHGVINVNKPGRIRVVFDAAARYSGLSLNDCLVSGPDLLNDLLGCILRFRQHPIAIMADIRAMFNNVLVDEVDRDSLRFLWWEKGDTSKPPIEYQMKTHVFGLISSPCCAITALRRTAEDDKDLSDDVVNIVNRCFYMDDLLLSMKNREEAVAMVAKLTDVLKTGGFNLTKWISNDPDVLKNVEDEKKSSKLLNMDKEEKLVERALGVKWDVSKDEFVFKVDNFDRPPTKRGILSFVSSIFNPDGLLSPLLLIPKLLLRDLWHLKIDWDDPLPQDILEKWLLWKENLKSIESVTVPRYIGGQFSIDTWKFIDLHIFCDASELGFSAVAYLRFELDDIIHCCFILGKSRCAPLKTLTIPRLELQAAVLGARLLSKIKEELDIKLDSVYIWSDSMTTLAYIRNKKRKFLPFVANRVAEICDITDVNMWNHCPGVINVADDGSRGLLPCEFNQDCRWLTGPSFLWKPRCHWPQEDCNIVVPEINLEVKKTPQICVTQLVEVDPLEEVTTRIGSWYKLKRIVACCFRFASLSSKKCNREDVSITTDDLKKAEIAIIKSVQKKFYPKEIDCLMKDTQLKGKSSLLKLCPTIDDDGVVRVGSRIKFADLPEETKFPAIIPFKHPIADAIIHEAHVRMAHGGVEMVMAEVRRSCWIPKLRCKVKFISHRCIGCRKLLAGRLQQQMAPLPLTRVTMTTPFDNCGVDFFGPFYVKVRRTCEKRWCCLFTCFSTRAVHLEATSSMDTDRFISVLRRFQARRGQPSRIYSDNGSNFVGAEKELRYAIENWNHQKIKYYLQQSMVEWKFNPPAAPHMGGCWERIVKIVKRCLKAILRSQTLSQETFDTVLCDVEAVLNSRPLTQCSDDVSDFEPLTPFHFLLLKSSPALPPGQFGSTDIMLRKHWRQAQALVNKFWKRWQSEYLTTLHQRTKWTSPRPNVKIGDLVLIAEDNMPRGHWSMGRVTDVHQGADKLIRSVKVKTTNGELCRPVTKLCSLENSSV